MNFHKYFNFLLHFYDDILYLLIDSFTKIFCISVREGRL